MSGRCRVRYAANQATVAARERFPARSIAEADGDLWLVQLAIETPALAFTHQANLDVLRVDDRVSTGRIDPSNRIDPDPLLDTCGQPFDAIFDWWNGAPPPLVYRSRTAPETGRNLAFSHTVAVAILDARPLREATGLHAHLALRAGFEIPIGWLG